MPSAAISASASSLSRCQTVRTVPPEGWASPTVRRPSSTALASDGRHLRTGLDDLQRMGGAREPSVGTAVGLVGLGPGTAGRRCRREDAVHVAGVVVGQAGGDGVVAGLCGAGHHRQVGGRLADTAEVALGAPRPVGHGHEVPLVLAGREGPAAHALASEPGSRSTRPIWDRPSRHRRRTGASSRPRATSSRTRPRPARPRTRGERVRRTGCHPCAARSTSAACQMDPRPRRPW